MPGKPKDKDAAARRRAHTRLDNKLNLLTARLRNPRISDTKRAQYTSEIRKIKSEIARLRGM